jgi:hypothetical protein
MSKIDTMDTNNRILKKPYIHKNIDTDMNSTEGEGATVTAQEQRLGEHYFANIVYAYMHSLQ